MAKRILLMTTIACVASFLTLTLAQRLIRHTQITVMARSICGSNLRGIGQALAAYTADFDAPPTAGSSLVEGRYIRADQVRCVMRDRRPYVWIIDLPAPAGHWIILLEPLGNHLDGSNAVFVDGHSEFLTVDRLAARLGQQMLIHQALHGRSPRIMALRP